MEPNLEEAYLAAIGEATVGEPGRQLSRGHAASLLDLSATGGDHQDLARS